jgi:hypothetical protein
MGSPRTVWLAGPVVAMVAVRRAPTTSPLGHILSVLDEDGGLVVEGMFDPEHISALRRAVLGRAFGYGAARDAAPGTATQGIRRGDLAEFVGRNTVRFSSLGSLAPDAFLRDAAHTAVPRRRRRDAAAILRQLLAQHRPGNADRAAVRGAGAAPRRRQLARGDGAAVAAMPGTDRQLHDRAGGSEP